jgi:curved DNA-binding protein CbpA
LKIVFKTIDYYDLLGVPAGATEADIRRAYRSRAIFRHRHGVLKLQDQMHEMEHAYEVLTDPERRQRYDKERELYRAPERRQVEEVTATVRREGRLRRDYFKKIARQSERMGTARSARYAAFMDELERQLAASAPQRRYQLPLLLALLLLAALTYAVFAMTAR